MLSPAEIASLIAATKNAVDIFDKLSGPIKRVLLPKEDYGWKDAKDQRWRFKVGTKGKDIVVRQDERIIQTISGKELEQRLSGGDLKLVVTYEKKMEDYFDLWTSVYEQKDMSPDPLVNAKVEKQLKSLIKSMDGELLGILDFLETKLGVGLDDHYMHVRQIVEKEAK